MSNGVTLRWPVENQESRSQADGYARDTKGVVRVTDLIKVGEMQ
ncbi:MAG TPA: hypothetical protein VHQ90_13225 [Thermoanaerobaculia bacterium]|nr:hypothetical protein [Thermoanaerobaculia bacterium]